MKTIVFRIVLSGLMLIPVYKETGTWTVIVLALIMLGMEAEALLMRTFIDTVKGIKR